MSNAARIEIPDDVQIAWDIDYVRRFGLPGFAKISWAQLEPRTPLKWGWALDAICEHLEAVSSGEIRRLLMNVPPGTMKSYLTSVLWPSFEWGPLDMPHMQYLATSYSEPISTRDSRRMRNFIQTKWYQDRWPMPLIRAGETSFENSEGGFRESMAFNSLTGSRGDRVMIDDPHSTDKAESLTERKRTIRTWNESVPLRVNDPMLSAIVVIMQRLHQKDVSGEILSDSDTPYVHLCLPMEYEPNRRCVTRIGFMDPRTEPDELLFPERFPREVVDADKKVLGPFASAGQMQQRPTPREGNIVKIAWFAENRFKERGKNPIRVVQSWDCLDTETEVLTADGWRGRGEISIGDLVYALVPGTDRVELVPASDVGERNMAAGERWITISSLKRNIRVTEGHRLYVGRKYGRAQEKVWGIELGRDFVANDKPYGIRTAGRFDFKGVTLTDDELRFIAWFITDGGFQGKHQVKIAQAKVYRYQIRSLLDRLGFEYRKRIDTKDGRRPLHLFSVPSGISRRWRTEKGWIHLKKYLDKDLADELLEMTRDQFAVFSSELLKGDGDEAGHLCCGLNKRFADRIQEMAVVRGFTSTKWSRPATQSRRMIHYVNFRDREMVFSRPMVPGHIAPKFESSSPNEIAWCVTNQHGTLITRRGGQVAIVGNCASKPAERNDPSACLTIAEFKDHYELWHYVVRRQIFPELVRHCKDRFNAQTDPAVKVVLIEDKDAGQQLIQQIRHDKDNKIPVIAYNPGSLDKETRLDAETSTMEAGDVWLPEDAPWVDPFLEELTSIPAAPHDESGDTLSQALHWIGQKRKRFIGAGIVSVGGKESARMGN